MLELYYNFFHTHCDENSFKELQMDTDSLYLALAEDNPDDSILPEKKAQRTLTRQNDCRDELIADAMRIFFPLACCALHKRMINENPDYSKKNSAVLKCCACAARPIATILVRATKLKLVAKDLTK